MIMNKLPFVPAVYWRLAAVLVLALTVGACTTLSSGQKNQGDTSAKSAPPSNTVYYDFDDIELPRELKVDRDDSFVYNTTGFAAGVLTLKGRVEFDSLVRFFETSMPKDNWRPVGHIKAESAMILFHKENRWCVITMEEGSYNTYVRVWVAPTVFSIENTLLPPATN